MVTGHIYVLVNSYIPDLVKIGRTTLTPQERAEQISRPTGVPGKWNVAYCEHVKNVEEAEKHVHRHLKSCRRDKEFFKISKEDAIKEVKKICSYYPIEGSKFGEISPEEVERNHLKRISRQEKRDKIQAENERQWHEQQEQNEKLNENQKRQFDKKIRHKQEVKPITLQRPKREKKKEIEDQKQIENDQIEKLKDEQDVGKLKYGSGCLGIIIFSLVSLIGGYYLI